jgi:hypothetical protein
MLALAIVLIFTAFVVVACEERAEAPVQVPGTSVDIDVDRSKPRPKMTAPAPAAPKVVIPKQRSGGKR